MEFDALLLSRIQFAFTMAFHIIFPAFTIGLASWLARLEFEWLRTGNPQYKNLYKFWVKVFAVSFGLGVVSGIVMSYQLGTNWSRSSEYVGNVLCPWIGGKSSSIRRSRCATPTWSWAVSSPRPLQSAACRLGCSCVIRMTRP